jgi:hypothetical protein
MKLTRAVPALAIPGFGGAWLGGPVLD